VNLLWLLFHFIQRPFDPTVYGYYMLWLILSGMVMSFALLKGGLGAAVTLHFIVKHDSVGEVVGKCPDV
jgi:hypothetical protein